MTGQQVTGSGNRRAVKLHCFNCLRGELDRFEEIGADNLKTTGDLTAAQIVQHISEVVTRSIDGFEFSVPWFVRLFRPLIRKKFIGTTTPLDSGIKLKGESLAMIPAADFSLTDAIANLRNELERANEVKMTQPSPVFGVMTHEDWTSLHLRHAELHFSFIQLPS